MGPCHHGLTRPQVVDGEMASNLEGMGEYTEYAVTDGRQEVVLQRGSLERC